MRELSFRELFPEINDSQIKMLKRYMLEILGDDELIVLEDIFTEIERRTKGLHPYNSDYQSIVRESMLNAGRKLGAAGARAELREKIEDL